MAKNQSKPESSDVKTFSLISNEKLLAIYTTMLKCRLLEQRATALFQHGKLDSDLHGSTGLEATAAAAAIDLQQNDTLCLAPGDWLPSFVKGISLDALFRVLAPVASQRSTAPAIEAAHKNILFPTESDLPKAALDRATAAQGEKSGAVAAAFISAGPDNLAPWRQTMQVAGTKRLPIIFVHYVDPAIAFQPANSNKHGALLHGVPSIAVDALDAVAVYRVAYEAIVRARQLRGATLLQCILQRDSPLAEQVPVNSVETMETYLKSKGMEPEGYNHEVVAAFNRDLDLATRFLHQ